MTSLRFNKKYKETVFRRFIENALNYILGFSRRSNNYPLRSNQKIIRNADVYNEKPFTDKKSPFTALKLAKIGQWELELATRKLHLSPEHIEMMGYQRAEIPENSPIRLHGKFCLQRRLEHHKGKSREVDHRQDAEFPEHLEYRLIRQDDSIGHIFVTIHGERSKQ